MWLHSHIVSFVGFATAVFQLAAPSVPQAQGIELRAKAVAHQVSRVYDRLTDSTRESFTLNGSSRPYGLNSRVWLDLAFNYPGRCLIVAPERVVLTLTCFTPARGGWASARPHKLRLVSGHRVSLEIPAAEYRKLRVGLFDMGRRETLSFWISSEQFAALAAEPELELKAGNARMRLRQQGMAMLQEVARRLTPTAGAR